MTQLVTKLKTKQLLISYNNEGIISETEFKKLLKKIGKVTIYKSEYKKYKSRKEDQNQTVTEYIYFVDKTKKTSDKKSKIITI